MKIYDLEAESGLSLVGLALTPREAEELRSKLRSLLDDPQNRSEVVSSDDYQTEVRVWIAGQIAGRDES